MSEGKTFTCPNCGGSLSLENAAAQIECPYCGSMVVVPKELRPAEATAGTVPVSINVDMNQGVASIPMGDVREVIDLNAGVPPSLNQFNRWLVIGILAFTALIILVTVIPVVCAVMGMILGIGGAFLPFFVK